MQAILLPSCSMLELSLQSHRHLPLLTCLRHAMLMDACHGRLAAMKLQVPALMGLHGTACLTQLPHMTRPSQI